MDANAAGGGSLEASCSFQVLDSLQGVPKPCTSMTTVLKCGARTYATSSSVPTVPRCTPTLRSWKGKSPVPLPDRMRPEAGSTAPSTSHERVAPPSQQPLAFKGGVDCSAPGA